MSDGLRTSDGQSGLDSPFLDVPLRSWLAENRSAFAIAAPQPVSAGHSLIVPRRLVSSWWETSDDERFDIWSLVDEVRTLLDVRHAPAGYNVGFDSGAAAGQDIGHLHLHVIPRFERAPSDPVGGIRAVVPGEPTQPHQASQHAPQVLIDGGERGSLKHHLQLSLAETRFDRIDLLVSFIMQSGLALIRSNLSTALERGAHVRILTTDYLFVTQPDAIAKLLDLADRPASDPGRLGLRAFSEGGRSFHPKAYLFWTTDGGQGQAFVGSNNLSRSGLATGVEWSLRTSDVGDLVAGFDRLWADPHTTEIDQAWLNDYRTRVALRPVPDKTHVPPPPPELDEGQEDLADVPPPSPRPIQLEALAALEATRLEGHHAGLVVLATGLGKTWLAAFDTDRPTFRRVLFVAHREEILTQARDVFRSVRPTSSLGLFTGTENAPEADVVFATIQTLSRRLGSFAADSFDYIVVDEFHHAAAPTYRRVIDHFEPEFLLGLTATPDRLDGAELLALCGDNLVHRCDLLEGIERHELVPFHYWGVADTVDFTPIPWRNGRFDPQALDAAVATRERSDAALREWRRRAGDRTLTFCSSISHADFTAAHFASAGVRVVSLHSHSEPDLRRRAIEMLDDRELDMIVTVDLFNEGVDLPELDTILMLRPTGSPTIFLQQLGRGLRTSVNKSHLDVVDFVGNHRSFLAPARTLLALRLGRPPRNEDLLRALNDNAFELPEGCSIDYSLDAIDLLGSLLRKQRETASDVLIDLCTQLAEEEGARPSALQVEISGGNVAAARRKGGSWFGFLDQLGQLSEAEQRVLERQGGFLREVETTAMTKSFKMVLLRALLHDGVLGSGAPIQQVAARSLQLVRGDPRLAADVDPKEFASLVAVDAAKWSSYWTRNPVAAWAGTEWFEAADGQLAPSFSIAGEDAAPFDAMVAELLEWRLHNYLRRSSSQSTGELVFRVSHSSGTPIIRFDRSKNPDIPEGATEFLAEGERYIGRFQKIALNVATSGTEASNALPALLRRWFGPAAGHPGSNHQVRLSAGSSGWILEPDRAGQRSGEESSLPYFPSYAVACGAFGSPTPADAAPFHLPLSGATVDSDEQFVVAVRGESMSGGDAPIRHGDLLRMRWTTRSAPEDLLGSLVLVERSDGGERRPALKQLLRNEEGFVLHSTAEEVPDLPATGSMTIVGELVGAVDQATWNPLAAWIGQEFRRDAVPALLGETYNTGNWGSSGHVSLEHDTVLFVTMQKESGRAGESYVDQFDAPDLFHWTSQASTGPDGKKGRELLDALDTGRRVHLFFRDKRTPPPFTYCGPLVALRHEGSKPMTVWFRLYEPLSPSLQRRFLS